MAKTMLEEDYREEGCKAAEKEARIACYKPTGKVTLDDVKKMSGERYDVLDLTEAEFGFEEEYWEQVLGYGCNFCAVVGNSGYRDVEVLKRLLGEVTAHTVILPDDVCRRHVNVIIRNPNIIYAEVRPTCKLFSMKGNALMNKKGTKLVYQPMR